ncbi:MAG: hypothetical protein KIT83_06595 [Bryobacterales bacterium]|nr:hypothetical protein [Bryobacterales bacterium]
MRIRYAEALYEKSASGRPEKGDRGVVEGRDFVGYCDEFLLDGGPNQNLPVTLVAHLAHIWNSVLKPLASRWYSKISLPLSLPYPFENRSLPAHQ